MERPKLHDARFAMTDDLRNHISLLEEYATKLEGGLELARSIIREQNDRLAALKAPSPTAKTDQFGSIFESFFGSKK